MQYVHIISMGRGGDDVHGYSGVKVSGTSLVVKFEFNSE
jgi:hypothetical protein